MISGWFEISLLLTAEICLKWMREYPQSIINKLPIKIEPEKYPELFQFILFVNIYSAYNKENFNLIFMI